VASITAWPTRSCGQPGSQLGQPRGKSLERPHILTSPTLTLSWHPDTSHHAVLVHIQPGDALYHHLHNHHLQPLAPILGCRRPEGPGSKDGETRARSNNPGYLTTPTPWSRTGSQHQLLATSPTGTHSFHPPGCAPSIDWSREKAPINPDLPPRPERETAGQAPVPYARDAPTSVSMVAGETRDRPTGRLRARQPRSAVPGTAPESGIM
jgi:hypothetical protein